LAGALLSGLLVAFFLAIALHGSGPLEIPSGLRLIEPAAGLSPHPGEPAIRVAIDSDPLFDEPGHDRTVSDRIMATVQRGAYDGFFLLGDAVNYGLTASGWNLALARLSAGLGPVPLRALFGHHDSQFNGQEHYRQAFFPVGMKSDSGSPFYYTVEAGPVRFFFLNLIWGEDSFDPAQRRWLERALDATPPGVFKVVLSHSFLRSSGYVDPLSFQPWYDNADLLQEVSPLLAAHGVDLVVSGHNHYQEYLVADGLRYAVIGTMGAHPDPSPDYVSPARVWFDQQRGAWLELAAFSDRLVLAFRDPDGGLLYHTTITKTPAPVTSQP
jgi:hypothetical protein